MLAFLLTCMVFAFISFLQVSEGIYGNCWNGKSGNGGQYYGTLAVTSTGRICQAWSSQTPQTHSYTDDWKFPYDGGVAGANNYCRDPDFNYQPWCYTTDPWYAWDTCNAPICTNLPCSVNAFTGPADPSTLSANVDANSGVNYLLTDAAYVVPCCGKAFKWKLYVRNAGTIRLQIWREDTATGDYILIGENAYTYSAEQADAYHEEEVSQSQRISVEEGDMLGWYVTTDMISYGAGASAWNLLLSTAAPTIGQSVNYGAAGVEAGRDYAFGIDIAQNLAPYFTRGGTISVADSLSLTDATAIGTPIYEVFFTDDDPDDIASLSVTMTTSSTYFAFNTISSKIEVLSTLVPGTYPLSFEVQDHCDETGLFTVTITVTKAPVSITNLPSHGNVSESETTESLVSTLEFSAPGPFTCTIDSYLPTRVEGNPFLVQLTPTSEVGVYLKNAAAVRYNIATVYDATITCTDGSTSDTKLLKVNILPNSHPTFQSWQGSQSVNASATIANDIVYTATVNDIEGDTITMGMVSCLPAATCPFNVNPNGEIFATQNLLLHEVQSYDIILSADDSFNTVSSPLLTITLTDLNDKPVFTNIPITIPVLESTPSGSKVFQVSQYDGEGDTPTFSATYLPVACSTLFSVAAADGRITTLANFDFETAAVTTCTVTVLVNDGKMFSDPDIVTLEITNVDEPPNFSNTLYKITTPEVVDGTVLPNPGITVTDPEGTSVTLLPDCDGDSGHLFIDSVTRLVTMVTTYHLDPFLPTYTIRCNITATDGTGQSSTSSLEVQITDANDNPPIFSSGGYTVYILNTSPLGVIGSAPATDDDSTAPNNVITYSITGSTKFNIDASGNVSLVGDVTTDTILTLYTLTVTATDGGVSPLSNTVTFQVFVSNGTTTTTTSATVVVGSQGTGFFSDTLNIIWFAIGIALGTFVLTAGAYLLFRLCKTKFASGGAKMTDIRPKNNKLAKESAVKQVNNSKDVTNQDPKKLSEPKQPERPISSDSGINVLVRTPPDNTRSQPISVEPADKVTTSDNTNAKVFNQQIRQWKLDQGQWRSVLQAGRLKY